MINIKQLKYFITCADAGSFSEAASVLYTTQSSVSKVIRALEEEMQASLFVRNPHGISLTQNGNRPMPMPAGCWKTWKRWQSCPRWEIPSG